MFVFEAGRAGGLSRGVVEIAHLRDNLCSITGRTRVHQQGLPHQPQHGQWGHLHHVEHLQPLEVSLSQHVTDVVRGCCAALGVTQVYHYVIYKWERCT